MSMTCPKCDGSGSVLEPKLTGEAMRAFREERDVSVTGVAAELGLSKAYVSDLELGRRGWTTERVRRYKSAVNAANKGRVGTSDGRRSEGRQ